MSKVVRTLACPAMQETPVPRPVERVVRGTGWLVTVAA